MNNSDYRARVYAEQTYLKKCEAQRWLTHEELNRYVYELESKLNVLSSYLGVEVVRDYRNRWVVIPGKEDT